MSDNPPSDPGVPEPAEQTAYVPDAPVPEYDPVASANVSYDPMPLEDPDARSRNWMGIVSVVTAIIGFSVAAIVFGILGLNAVKQRKATNRALSIVGIVLGVLGFIAEIVLVVALVIWANRIVDASTAEVGDCYVSTITSTDALENVSPAFGACTDSTNAEVYYVTTYTGASAPGDDGFTDELFALCTSEEAIAKVNTDAAAEYYVEYFLPRSATDGWGASDKTVVCSLSKATGPVDEGLVNE